ncbi:MAG: hypothetical protein IT318_22795 [Anaerolineales bacterium]|nr:hypothetical protein [Anaerolineales bacterium]
MKKTIWQPLVLGVTFGLLAGIATATGLSFLTPGITDSAIGFYVTLFLLAAAQGGPLAGATASGLWVAISAWFGPPDMKAIIGIPSIFWSNLLALGSFTALVGVAYRWIFEHMKMPARLLPWAGIVIAFYLITPPSAITLQYYLLGDPASEILPAILATYMTYIPQAIFDIVFTSLVFIALPVRYRRPQWYEPKKTPA